MMRYLVAAFLLISASAQAALCPPGGKLNPSNIYRGTGDCGLASGDDLAAATANATNASNLTTGTVPPARLPYATPTAVGGVTVSTGLLATSGALSVIYGTSAGTAAQGNDSRIVGALQGANNLADVGSVSTALTNLGLNPGAGLTSAGGTLTANVQSVFGRAGAVTLLSSDIASALGFVPIPASGAPVQSVAGRTGAISLGASDISGFASAAASAAPVQLVFGRTGNISLLFADVTGALGFTPYSAANPSGYIAASGAPVQSVAGLTGAPTSAQVAVALGGTTGVSLAFGNDPRLVGALQPATVTGIVKSTGSAFAAAAGPDIAAAGGLAASCLGAANGCAQLDSGGTAGSLTVLSRPLSAWFGDVINVKQYGATGNGTADDTAAINAAAAAFAAKLASGKAAILLFQGGNFVVKTAGGINLTGLNSYDGLIRFEGATILCQVSTVCIDATGSQHISWENPSFSGDPGYIPTVGLQMARQGGVGGAVTACGNQTFTRIKANGYFSKAALMNGACETDQFFGGLIENDNPAAGCYAYIMDGSNHWNWQSAFVTVTTPVDTALSMGDNLHDGLTKVSSCNSPAISWAENTQHTRFVDGYDLGRGAWASFALYDDGHGGNTSFSVDQHTEGSAALNYLFFITGANATPTLAGVDYLEHNSQARTAIFHADTGITAITYDGDVRLEQANSSPPKIWDQPQLWTVTSGTFRFPSYGYWNSPASFTGTLCLAGACTPLGNIGPVDATGNLASGAYSCNRQLVLTYKGPLCNLRRSSDSATLDFYPNALGDLPLASVMAWAGSSTIYVTEAYDQSGNACHAIQTTTANQPTLTLYQVGGRGKPSMVFGDGSAVALTIAPCSALTGWFATGGFATAVAYAATATPSTPDMLWNNNGNNTYIDQNGNTLVFNQRAATTNGNWRTPSNSVAVGLMVIDVFYSQALNANIPVFEINGASQSYIATTQPVGTISGNINSTVIGNNAGTGGNTGWAGAISEVVFWKTVLTTAQQEAVRRNQGAYYGVSVL